MSPTAVQPPSSPAQRPWRTAAPAPRHPARVIVRPFAAPVVRELPPRREARAAAGAW
jgi:hypothetical protein